MRVLVLHNRYQIAGGEEASVRQEMTMLRQAGAAVELLEVANDGIRGLPQRAGAALGVVYSWRSRQLVASRIAAFRPDVVHVHNFFPMLTPSVYDAGPGVAFVQTLHNYRLLCPNALLFRNGHACTECVGRRLAWPAVQHGCYRGSRAGSVAVAAMLGVHTARRTWRRVARFIALTEFARALFAANLDVAAHRIVVKPNAAPDAGVGDGDGGYALYVGRLSPEKGTATLVEAAGRGLGMPLIVCGSGPLAPLVESAAARGALDYRGPQPPEEVARLMRAARLLLLPSTWFEGLPMVLPEAFSAGLPVLASDIGALSTLVAHERNGLLVPPGDAEALAAAARRFAAAPGLEQSLRREARLTYERLYRPEANIERLLEIYHEAISEIHGA